MRLLDPRPALIAARKAQAALLYRPTGIFGRHAPFYPLNLLDWAALRPSRTPSKVRSCWSPAPLRGSAGRRR